MTVKRYVIKDSEIDFDSIFTKEQKDLFRIKSLKIDENGDWIAINDSNEFEICFINKFNHHYLTMLYQRQIVKKVIYICSICQKEVETSLRKFIKRVKESKPTCHKCSMGLPEVRNKISKITKEAMHRSEVKHNVSVAQKNRFAKPEEREKSRKRAKEIASRSGMKEKVSKATKASMKEVKTKRSFQEHSIIARRKILRSKKTNPQIVVEDFVKSVLPNCLVEDEFPISLYSDDSIEKDFMFVDIAVPSLRLAIEVLGIYHHACFIEHFFDKKSLTDIRKEYKEKTMQLQIFESDLLRDKYFSEHGWKVFYVTQSQLSSSNWQDKLKEFLHG